MDFSRFSCFGTTCSIMSSQLCWKQVVESTSLFPLARFSSHSVDMYLNGIFSNPGFMTLKHSRGKSKKNAFIGACLNMLKRNFELKNAITVEQRIFRKVIPRINLINMPESVNNHLDQFLRYSFIVSIECKIQLS